MRSVTSSTATTTTCYWKIEMVLDFVSPCASSMMRAKRGAFCTTFTRATSRSSCSSTSYGASESTSSGSTSEPTSAATSATTTTRAAIMESHAFGVLTGGWSIIRSTKPVLLGSPDAQSEYDYGTAYNATDDSTSV